MYWDDADKIVPFQAEKRDFGSQIIDKPSLHLPAA
jgi:hypothetical protein